MNKILDVVIIGGGCAGIGSAVQIAKYTDSILIIEEKRIGGRLYYAENISNMPAIESVCGSKCSSMFLKQLKNLKIKYFYEKCIGINEYADGVCAVTTDKKTVFSRYVIIAAGRKAKELKRFSVCSKQYHDEVKGCNVCIIGGGEVSADQGITLAKKGIAVDVISRSAFKKVNSLLMNRAESAGVNIVMNAKMITAVKIDKKIKVEYSIHGKSFKKEYSDLIVCIGTQKNRIKINLEGIKDKIIYAGSIKGVRMNQCAAAFADGIKAGNATGEKLKENK